MTCSKCKKEFEHPERAVQIYEKLDMPLPRECFLCRIQHILAFWIFGKFRKGKSDLSGKPLITTIPENPRFPVYTTKEWFSDDWEPPQMDYDPNRPFFEQLKELQERAPRPHQLGTNNVDCDWCDDVWDSKNCYLAKSFVECENIKYGYRNIRIKDSIDTAYCYDSQQSYDITFSFNCYRMRHSLNVRDSFDSAFLYDCRNCSNCFMCWNLRGKQYCIRNKQYSKENYLKELEKYDLGSWETIKSLKDEWKEHLREDAVHRANLNVKSYDSTGNIMTNCNKCEKCYYWEDSEDCAESFRGALNKSLASAVGTFSFELSAFTGQSGYGYQCKYIVNCNNCRYVEYLDQCVNCEYCFGCVGIRTRKYCILNKQYTKEEYEKLKQKIIESMKKDGSYGEYFPYSMAYSGYNITTTMLFKELSETKKSIEKLGGYWEDIDESAIEGTPTSELPDNIKDVKDDITKTALICPETGWRYNIAPDELKFYRQMKIPLPRYHFDHRTIERFSRIAIIIPQDSDCIFCGKTTKTFYSPELGYKKIACVGCYQKEVI